MILGFIKELGWEILFFVLIAGFKHIKAVYFIANDKAKEVVKKPIEFESKPKKQNRTIQSGSYSKLPNSDDVAKIKIESILKELGEYCVTYSKVLDHKDFHKAIITLRKHGVGCSFEITLESFDDYEILKGGIKKAIDNINKNLYARGYLEELNKRSLHRSQAYMQAQQQLAMQQRSLQQSLADARRQEQLANEISIRQQSLCGTI